MVEPITGFGLDVASGAVLTGTVGDLVLAEICAGDGAFRKNQPKPPHAQSEIIAQASNPIFHFEVFCVMA
jgi:hypothetical protein